MLFLKNNVLTLLIVLISFTLQGQARFYKEPLKISPSLTGNFGELRPGHFHLGLDFRTERRTGIPVYSVASGYISRIAISPTGYGRALYIDHPNQTTSLYGHLSRFREDIEEYIKEEQYRQESFAVNLSVPAGLFRVERHELIAFSGNSGSSGGPHLHFEIRDTPTQDGLNPLRYHTFNIYDRTFPVISRIRIHPLSSGSHVDFTGAKKSFAVVGKESSYAIQSSAEIKAYGQIGISFKANDYIDGSTNPNGIHSAHLLIDGKKVFSFTLNRIPYAKNRYLNSHIDYEEYVDYNSFYHKLWLERGNRLPIYETDIHRGILQVENGKVYNAEIILSDVAGNSSHLKFRIKGVYVPIPVLKADSSRIFRYYTENTVKNPLFELTAPEGAFYDDLNFFYITSRPQADYYSGIIQLHFKTTPVHKPMRLRIKAVDLPDSLVSRAFIAGIGETGTKSYVGGKLYNGWFETTIAEFGNYAVIVDTLPPLIEALSIRNNTLIEPGRIRFKTKDDLSGIMSYTGKIDGRWVLFEYDPKIKTLVYLIDPERFVTGKNHSLELKVSDRAGNKTTYTTNFYK